MKALSRRKSWLIAFLLLATTGDTGMAANKYVVIAVDPPVATFPLGRVLVVDDQIDVPAGAILTLLGDDGTVATIQGPERLVVTAEPSSDSAETAEDRTTFQRISDLLLGSSADPEVLGVSRSLGGSPADGGKRNPWAVPVERSGHICVRDKSMLLQRSEDLRELPLQVKTDQGTSIANGTWPKDSTVYELPPLSEERTQRLIVQFGDRSVELTVHYLPSEIKARRGMDVLKWLLETGCKAQAMTFARWLSEN